MKGRMKGTYFVCRSLLNREIVLCEDGEWRHQMFVGPGAYKAKFYKTRTGASKVRGGAVEVEEIQI